MSRPTDRTGSTTVSELDVFRSHRGSAAFLTGILAIIVSVGSLMLWSYFASLATAVVAPGIVVVGSGRKYVQHLTGGIVKAIYVSEGDRVIAGQVLVTLDPAVLDASLEAVQKLIALNVAMRARLTAEQAGISSVTFPSCPPNVSAVAWAFAVDGQRHLFSDRHGSMAKRLDSFRNEADQETSSATSDIQQLQFEDERIALTQRELKDASLLAQSGDDTSHHVMEVARSLATLQEDRSGLQARSQEALKLAHYDEIEKETAISNFRESAGLDLQQVEKEEPELAERFKVLLKQRDDLTIKAPVSGRVVNLSAHTVGGVIDASSPIMEIVPESDALVLEAQVRPEDIGTLTKGSPVDIRVAGVVGQNLPRLTGKVSDISADRLEDPVHGASFFRVRVESPQVKPEGGMGRILKPGVGVTLMIRSGQQSPVRYLISPLTEFFSLALH